MSALLRRLAAASALVAGLVGTGPAPPAVAAVERVEAEGTRFTPARVEIDLGDTVIWKAGDDDHTVTARDGSFDSSPHGLMGEGDQFRWRFRVPGTYAYFCRMHQDRGMRGTVVVVDPAAGTTSTTRGTPGTAAATTSSTAASTTTTTAPPTTTTTRVLATSSSTSPSQAIPTSAPKGTPAERQEPPALNPAAPVLDPSTGEVSRPAPAASHRVEAEDEPPPYLAAGLVAALLAAGGAVAFRRTRRSPG